tara:strand:+ start:125 stop:409 length:285 start_codon:yes stop_codon:yes gene_type:complete
MDKYVNGVLTPMTDAEIAEWNATNVPTDEQLLAFKWEGIRKQRNQLLSKTDWVAARASETGVAVSDDWKTYRQALRDVPTQSDPDNITWPTMPS